MDELFAHPTVILKVLAVYWAFSAIVSSMPDPPQGSFWYKWIYGALHAFAGNISKFAESKIRSLETTEQRRELGGAETVTKTKITETEPKGDK